MEMLGKKLDVEITEFSKNRIAVPDVSELLHGADRVIIVSEMGMTSRNTYIYIIRMNEEGEIVGRIICRKVPWTCISVI